MNNMTQQDFDSLVALVVSTAKDTGVELKLPKSDEEKTQFFLALAGIAQLYASGKTFSMIWDEVKAISKK